MSRIAERIVLFADLRGSTALFESLGNARATAVVTRCIDEVALCVSAHQGTVVKTLGDGLMAVFDTAADAFACARRMQDTLGSAAAGAPAAGRAAGLPRPRPHPDHPERGARDTCRIRRRQAPAVVFDEQPDFVRIRRQRHAHAPRARMPRNVRQRLLRDAEEMRLCLVRVTAHAGRGELNFKLGALRELLHQPAQPGVEAEVVENYRPKQLRQLAHIGDGFVPELKAIVPHGFEVGRAALREIGTHRRQRLPQFVVQFMGKAPGRLLLALQHVP